jgi:hypothetical protein
VGASLAAARSLGKFNEWAPLPWARPLGAHIEATLRCGADAPCAASGGAHRRAAIFCADGPLKGRRKSAFVNHVRFIYRNINV